jgi:hypothetical protein
MIAPWNVAQWQDQSLAEHLQKSFDDLGYTAKMPAMIEAYKTPTEENLEKMKEATGNTVRTTDINYIWTSRGRMALMLEKSVGKPDEMPHTDSTWDDKLRAWVIDLETMYNNMMARLEEMLKAARTEEEKAEIHGEMDKFDKKNTCDQGDWANGISVYPAPKFIVVSEWMKKYFPDELSMANQIVFYKAPNTKAPPFVQIKVHRTCFFFKGRGGPGTVLVNPELAKTEANELRDDLEPEVYSNKQFTVEVIGKGPDGKSIAGKLTILNDELNLLPMAPRQTNKFDPQAADSKTDAQNSYLAFKNSHPDTVDKL